MISKFNTHISRALMVFAILVVLLAAFPNRTEAAASNVYLGDVALINDNAWHSYNQSGATISGWTSGRYRLSSDSSTLFIDGLTFSSSTAGKHGIVSNNPLNIIATGTSSISCKTEGILINDTDGWGALTLSGGDTSVPTVKITSSRAVTAGSCTVTRVNFSATGDEDTSGAYFTGELKMVGGKIEATSLYAAMLNMAGGTISVRDELIMDDNSKTSVISDGLVTADKHAVFHGLLELKGGSLTVGGIDCYGGLTQIGGTLFSTKDDVIVSYGNYTGSGGSLTSNKAIHIMNGDMNLNGANVHAINGILDIYKGDLIATAGSLNVDKCGIKINRNLKVSGTATIMAGLTDPDDPEVYTSHNAVYVSGTLLSDGGQIQAISTNSEYGALRVRGEAEINGGTITASLNNADNKGFAAAFSGLVYLNGGKVTSSTNAHDYSCAMYCASNLQINNNAVLEAKGIIGGGLSVNGEFTLNNGTVTAKSSKGAALSTQKVTMNGGKLVMDGNYNSTWYTPGGVDLADDVWISEPADGRIGDASEYYYILTKYGYNVSHAVLQKVDSISVQIAPNNDLYEGDCYDPDNLAVNVKFADGSAAPLSYKTHTGMFSFAPLPTEPLSGGTRRVEVTCLTKKAYFDLNVKTLSGPVLSGTVSNDRHSLRWTNVNGAHYYELYGRKEGESRFRLLSSYNSSGFTNDNLSPGESWEYYVVAARDSDGGTQYYGPQSNHLTLTTALETPRISVTGVGYDSVSLSWNKIEGAEKYRVYRSNEGATGTISYVVTDEQFTDRYIVTGREYTYYVKAMIPDKGVYSAASNEVKATPKFTGETALKLSGDGKYELSWTSVPGATGYEIRRGSGTDGKRSLLTTVDANVTSFTDDSADIYSVYNYTVVPLRVINEGSFRGKESNIEVTKASEKPEPESPSEAEPEPKIVPPTKDEPEGTEFNLLQARSGKVTKNSIQIKWKRVAGAKKYIIYGNKCGITNKYKKLTATRKNALSFKKVAGKKVTKGTYFKFIVYAVDARGKIISASKTVHVATKGGKYGNDKGVKTAAKKNRVTLRKGKRFKLRAKAVPASKKLKVRRHRKISYETSNKKVAKVTSRGVIKAVGKGICYVFAYTQNGVFAKVKVIVK